MTNTATDLTGVRWGASARAIHAWKPPLSSPNGASRSRALCGTRSLTYDPRWSIGAESPGGLIAATVEFSATHPFCPSCLDLVADALERSES